MMANPAYIASNGVQFVIQIISVFSALILDIRRISKKMDAINAVFQIASIVKLVTYVVNVMDR